GCNPPTQGSMNWWVAPSCAQLHLPTQGSMNWWVALSFAQLHPPYTMVSSNCWIAPTNSRFPRLAMPRALLILSLGLLVTGCSEELGPVPMRVSRVRGVVREGSRPVSGGWIEFFPVDGTIGNLRSARLRADGSFDADGVAVGVNLIRLVN